MRKPTNEVMSDYGKSIVQKSPWESCSACFKMIHVLYQEVILHHQSSSCLSLTAWYNFILPVRPERLELPSSEAKVLLLIIILNQGLLLLLRDRYALPYLFQCTLGDFKAHTIEIWQNIIKPIKCTFTTVFIKWN